ncbi:hypothetical protein VTO42DRAFT_825 [Malbranchea cinnamomea]
MDCLRDKFVPGQLLNDRYLTVAPLNHGSFGMVFLAKDTQTGEQVAIKCLTKPSAEAAGSLCVDDKSEELDCHTRLGHHPNLVNLLHSFETNTHFFLVLEYCSMGDLYEAIKNNRGPLETEHVREFMLQLVDAVEYMHSKGLYHRDIKPENIFLCQDGSMKLGDFGLATKSSWSFEACVGSDRYMAPEQYDPSPAGYSTAKADIWSIGICLLNILFARNPFATPTESDVLFADYSRDRQSLFDVFPNMSQDTFEILSHSLALDPNKRSLSALREAILRAVSFTTDDESLDDFCTEDRDVVPASADREPLRTPSIQSSQINQGDSFPWAKALQSTPQQPIRQLSAIPDTESYSEDLFPPSELEGTSWFSVQAASPSNASPLDSTLGASFKSMALGQSSSRQPAVSESLPAPTTVKPIPAMSMVFGKNDQVSKSWSDLWDEEEEMENELKARQERNARTWSQDSKDASVEAQPAAHSEVDTSSPVSNTRPIAIGNAKKSPRFSHFRSSGAPKESPAPIDGHFRSPRYSPPKRSILDKWAALGDRRRNHHPDENTPPFSNKQSPKPMSWRKDWGCGNQHRRCPYNELLNKDWRRDSYQTVVKSKKNIIPSCDGVLDDDFDWIGGWHDLHI